MPGKIFAIAARRAQADAKGRDIPMEHTDWAAYLNGSAACSCGRGHNAGLKTVMLAENALEQLPGWIARQGYGHIFVVSDCHTEAVAGQRVKALLRKAGLAVSAWVYPDPALVPDEAAIGRLFIALPPEADLILAVGTGTLGDLCRFASFKRGIPFLTAATAPSMDGFSSNVAPLIVDHLKTTFEAQVPLAVFGDLDLLRRAPMEMIAAGVGDILGKHVCLLDWRVSHLVTGEYHCGRIESMVEKSIQAVTEGAGGLPARRAESVQAVMEALVLSGVAISYAGNSRPASGSEHHLSHYWEMQFLFSGKPPVLHGAKVAVGTVAAVWLYRALLRGPVDFDRAREHAAAFDAAQWETDVRSAYGPAAEGVLALERQTGKNDPGQVMRRIDALEQNWPKITALIRERLPALEDLISLLRGLGAPYRPDQLGIADKMVADAVRFAKDLRNRYGLLQLLFDLGLQRELAAGLLDFFAAERDRDAAR